jgi:hypothetical protein
LSAAHTVPVIAKRANPIHRQTNKAHFLVSVEHLSLFIRTSLTVGTFNFTETNLKKYT